MIDHATRDRFDARVHKPTDWLSVGIWTGAIVGLAVFWLAVVRVL